jgi:RNA polymerase sigma-70 factor (ECF subfamily)
VPIEDFAETLADGAAANEGDALDVPRLLAQLPERGREIVRLISIEGQDVRAVAARLEMSEVNVRVSLHRSLKSLAALYRKDGA